MELLSVKGRFFLSSRLLLLYNKFSSGYLRHLQRLGASIIYVKGGILLVVLSSREVKQALCVNPVLLQCDQTAAEFGAPVCLWLGDSLTVSLFALKVKEILLCRTQ